MFWSRQVFFSFGETWATLHACGTSPVDIDLFIVFVRKGRSGATAVFSSDEGSGSMPQLFDGEAIMVLKSSSEDTGGSVSMVADTLGSKSPNESLPALLPMSRWMLAIFSLKNLLNISTSSLAG